MSMRARDLIVWGQREKLMEGNLNEGDKHWYSCCLTRRCSQDVPVA